MAGQSRRRIALAEALLVTSILGSSLVLVKILLSQLGPLTITALRYALATLVMVPFLVRRTGHLGYSRQVWFRLFLIGVSFYVVGNGALYLGLQRIPATTGSLLLSLVPLLVLLGGIVWLDERPSRPQLAGVGAALVGGALFFSPGLEAGEAVGTAIVGVGLTGNAAFSLLGRDLARDGRVDTAALTALPLAVGSGIVLPLALFVEGVPQASPTSWAILVWLAVVNTAGVYALYNHALRELRAFELSTTLNLTPLVTGAWAWLLLGERLRPVEIGGMLVLIAGISLVQQGQPGRAAPS